MPEPSSVCQEQAKGKPETLKKEVEGNDELQGQVIKTQSEAASSVSGGKIFSQCFV